MQCAIRFQPEGRTLCIDSQRTRLCFHVENNTERVLSFHFQAAKACPQFRKRAASLGGSAQFTFRHPAAVRGRSRRGYVAVRSRSSS